MLIDIEETSEALVCHLAGNMEQHTAHEFRAAVASLPATARVVFELSSVPFVDSSGLGALIGAVRRIREMSGDVVVCAPRTSVARVFGMVGLPRIVPVLPSLEEAAGYFSDPVGA